MPSNPLHELIEQLGQFIPAFWQCHHAATKADKDEALKSWLTVIDPFWTAYHLPSEAIRRLADPALAWCRRQACSSQEQIATVENAVRCVTELAMVTTPCALSSVYANKKEAEEIWESQGVLLMAALDSRNALRRLTALAGVEWQEDGRMPLDSGSNNLTRAQTPAPTAPEAVIDSTNRSAQTTSATDNNAATTAPAIQGPFLTEMADGSRLLFDPSGEGVKYIGSITNTAHPSHISITPPELSLEHAVYEVSGGRYVSLSWGGPRSARTFRGKVVSRAEAAAEFVKDGLPLPSTLRSPSGEAIVPVTPGDQTMQPNHHVTTKPGAEEESSASSMANAAAPTGSPPGTSPAPSKPRWNQWALALEAGNKWHLFRLLGGEWRPQKLVEGISKGRQTDKAAGDDPKGDER
jgi:hypothetical protein